MQGSDLKERLRTRAKTSNGTKVGAGDGDTYTVGYYSDEDATLDREAASEIERLEAANDKLAGLLWYAYHEFNAIRARSGAPLDHHGMTLCAAEYWDRLTEAFRGALRPDEVTPWPSDRAREALASIEQEKPDV